jgi:hypothetical protein
MNVRTIAGVGAALILGGCASTSMTSVPNPQVAPRSYQHVLVVFPLADLELRQTAEDELVSRAGANFTQSYGVLFPGRTYSAEELASALQENDIDAVLLISLSDAGSTSSYVPPSYSTSCSLYSTSQGCVSTTTSTSGGYSLDKPWANFAATLFDLKQNAVVWYATARSGGNAFADSEDLVRSMVRKTAERLVNDGVVR